MAIAFVSSVAAGSSYNNNVTTGSADTSGATLLVVVVSTYGTGGTLTDSNSNTWNALTRRGSAGDAGCQIYYAVNPTVGSGHTFTYSSTAKYPSVAAMAFSGADTSSPFDVQNGANNTTMTTLATGSVTPSEDNELIIAGYGGYSGAVSSIDSGMTIANSVAYSANHLAAGSAYKIQTTATAINATWTIGSASINAAAIATFKAAAGGGGPVIPVFMNQYRQRAA